MTQPPPPGFFRRRLVHFPPQYEQQIPGLIVSNWVSPRPSWKQRIVRCLLYKLRQGRSSPPGMSTLPLELLELIFNELCGRETLAVRLVCTEWEQTSRLFFAERYLRRSLFWLTASDLKRLEGLAHRFGPHIGDIHIATDHFTLRGLREVWKEYERQRDYLRHLTEAVAGDGSNALVRPPETHDGDDEIETGLIGYIVQPLRNGQAYKNGYYSRQVYQQRHPLSPWKTCRLREFLTHFLWSIVTQWWMKITGLDRRRLVRIAEMMPQGQLRIAEVDYDAEKLNENEQSFGRPSPAYAFALALLCADTEILRNKDYGGHVRRVVDRAMEERKARLFPARDET